MCASQVLISGLVDDWPAKALWASREAFLARHGNVSAGLMDSAELIFGGPEASMGLGRIVALRHRPSTSHRIH